MRTVAQLKKQIIDQTFPSGESENLVDAHGQIFQEAFAEIAKFVDCERDNNVNVIDFCKTFFKCGMTVVTAPRGIILRVFTVVKSSTGDDYCDPVFLTMVNWPEPECLARNVTSTKPSNVLPKLPLAFQAADSSTDILGTCGRARSGVWALHDGNIYIFPWLQSNEKLVIEWKGIKTEWSDEDLLNPDQDYKKAVKLYFQYGHERDYGSMEKAHVFHRRDPNTGQFVGLFDTALGDLMWECRERTKLRQSGRCANERGRFYSEISDDVVADPATLVLAQIGGYGSAGGSSESVSDLVNGFTAAYVLAAGGNVISGLYDDSAGLYYHQYLNPYSGSHGDGGATQMFWPAPDTADLAQTATYQNFFTTPNNGRYYDVCLGLVHLFVVSASDTEPDGRTEDSAQGQWLRAKLLLSTAKWKIVLLAYPPYTSFTDQDVSALRWSFKSWGADMVISGGVSAYERLDVAGLPMIVQALGGAYSLNTTYAAIASSEFIYNAGYGAGKITATKDSLKYEFYKTDGTLVDSVTIE